MDLADPEIEPATRLLLPSPVVGVIPVVLEYLPYLALPLRLLDGWATPPVVGGEVMVVSDRVDRHLLG